MVRMKVVIGDVHGCIEELDELLKKIEYKPEAIDLYFAGDLLDRGPDPIACVRRVRELKAHMIKGNHEDTNLRWRAHEEKQKATGKPNPMHIRPTKFRQENEALSDEDIAWMEHLPLKIDLGDNLWLLHGGCEPRYSLQDQLPNQIIRARYVNEYGASVSLKKDKSQPDSSVFWTTVWNGPESIIYGHNVNSLMDVRIDERPNGAKCIGIDTGCVFGGRLTAYYADTGEVVQVQAKKEYWSLRKTERE